jgi:tetratricopeptide (TPR) repeat protein
VLVRAGERAASLAAAAEARAYFQQAAELTDSALVQAELNERAGQMAYLEGNAEVSEQSFERAAQLFTEAGHTHAAARAQARWAEVDFARGRLEQAVERIRTAHEVLASDEPDPDFALVAAQLGRFLAMSSRDEEAVKALEQALELAEHLELPEVYSNALSSRAVLLVRQTRLDEGTTILRRAVDVALENDLPAAGLRARNNLGVALETQDQHRAVERLTDESIALARRAGDRMNETSWTGNSIFTSLALGRWDEALAVAEQMRAGLDDVSMEWAVAPVVEIAVVHARRGELDAARDVVEAHREVARGSDNIELRIGFAVIDAEVLRLEGRPKDALETATGIIAAREQLGLNHGAIKRGIVIAVDAALDLDDVATADDLLGIVRAAKPGEVMPYLRAHTARLAARVSILNAEPETVEQGFASAVEVFRELEMPFDLGVALLDHAEWLVDSGRAEDADALIAEAREIFDRLGARPWVERVAALEAFERRREAVG